MPPSNRPFLLISGEKDSWAQVLERSLAPLATLQIADETAAIDLVIENDYAAIFVDAVSVADFGLLTSRIRAQRPDARVIVVTASLTWRHAREAFRSGATDYFYRSIDRKELESSVAAALKKPVLPWPR
jgi:DNA-binding NtrC family response regulator